MTTFTLPNTTTESINLDKYSRMDQAKFDEDCL